MNDAFDLVVIGSGSAASVVAGLCRRAGWSVAMIDERPFGGTCALRGCDPKKVLVGAAEVVDARRRWQGHGIAGDLHIEWPALMAFKRTFTDPSPDRKQRALESSGIVAIHGHARFTSPTGFDVGGRELQAKAVVIGTGSRPAPLSIPGAEWLVTSDDFLELTSLPSRIVFVGGGYISFEFAHLAARAGATVTILHRGHQPLAEFDPDLVQVLVRHTRGLGIDVGLQTEVVEVARDGTAFAVTGRGDAASDTIGADLVVHGAGRVPMIDGLDLEAGHVAYRKRGIDVTPWLQSTSNPAVFAGGDVVGRGPALTPVASYDGRVIAANLLEQARQTVDYANIPSVVFTEPPLARVGLQEAEAHAQNLDVDVHSGDMSQWYSARRLVERAAAYKTIVDRRTRRVLGAHVLGPHAPELINLFALAMRHALTVEQIKSTLFAYPTGASDVQYML